MGVITDSLNTISVEKSQRDDAFFVRTMLVKCTKNINQCHKVIQEVVDSGNFNTLPNELKVVLNAWWVIIKTARTSIGADEDIMEVYDWYEGKVIQEEEV